MKNKVMILFKNSSFKYCTEERMRDIIKAKSNKIAFILFPVTSKDVQGGWIPVYPNNFMLNFRSADLTYQICVRYREPEVNYMRNFQLKSVSVEIDSLTELYNQIHSIILIDYFNTQVNIKEYQLGREYNYDFYKFSLDCYGEEDLLASIRAGLEDEGLQNDLVSLVLYRVLKLVNSSIISVYRFGNAVEMAKYVRRMICIDTAKEEWKYLNDTDAYLSEDSPLKQNTIGFYSELTESFYFVTENDYSTLAKIECLNVVFLQKYIAYPDRGTFDPSPDQGTRPFSQSLISESSISINLIDCIIEFILCGNYFYSLMDALINNPLSEAIDRRSYLDNSHISIALSLQFLLKDGEHVTKVFTETNTVSLEEILISIRSIRMVNDNMSQLAAHFLNIRRDIDTKSYIKEEKE